LRNELRGLTLLAIALAFSAVALAPEITIERVTVNDLTFHLAASERLGHALVHGEPFMDPWVSEWSLGFPLWRSYQPLPHLVAAAFLALTHPFSSHDRAFAVLNYILMLLLPISVYVGARLLGLGSLGAGFASLLVFATAAEGEYARYGIGYGSIVWRGTGLYTQLFALILFVPALGIAARAVDTGRNRITAAVGLALTSLSHIIFGYVIFASIGVWALAGPRSGRERRIARLVIVGGLALTLIAWFVIPMFLVRHELNRSRWEDVFKFDSYGAPAILMELFSGNLFDSSRFPVFSLMFALAAALAAINLRQALPRRLLALVAFWLLLFFGRNTWGHLLTLVGIPTQFHLHRLQGAFELSAVLLTAWGIAEISARALRNYGVSAFAAGIALGFAFSIIGAERAHYLRDNATMGRANLAAYSTERSDLDASIADMVGILSARPGRAFAGPAATWGNTSKIGATPLYAFLTRYHFDEVSFLYHSISLPSDIMVLKGESAASDALFGVRTILATGDVKAQLHWHLRSSHGPLRVYEDSPEGYFSLVDIGGCYDGPLATAFDTNSQWLNSSLMSAGIVLALDRHFGNLRCLRRWEAMPPVEPAFTRPRGEIISEQRNGEEHSAEIRAVRPCYALIKITWFPDLVATVDGRATEIIRVTPGFGAIAVGAGTHHVEVRYAPGPLKPILFLVGIVIVGLCATSTGAARLAAVEQTITSALTDAAPRLATPRALAAFAVAVLIILSTRALLRGQLIDGHDATEYPPRLVEFTSALLQGHQLPPLWAPDLGSGHGQPLFEFAPPLIYAAALPLRLAGFSSIDALQFALAFFVALGGIAFYLLARIYGANRFVALAVTGGWLFAPYLDVDLYVSSRFAEASALALAPLALLALERVLDRPSFPRIAAGAAAMALIPLGHNAMALLLFPVFGALVVFEAAVSSHRSRVAVAGAATVVGGLALSAFFWMPALLEKDFVKTELLRTDFLNWRIHAISPYQLLWSRWGFGYSVAGPHDGLSFAPGLLMISLALIGAAIALRSKDPRRRARTIVFTLAAVTAGWLATGDSAVVWSRVETLQYLAYPWRTLSVVALMLPLLALPALQRLSPRGVLAVLGLILLLNLSHTEPKGYLTYDEEYYAPQSIAEKGLNTTTREEYEPRWVATRPPDSAAKLRARDGQISVQTLKLARSEQLFKAAAAQKTNMEALTFYYPGWSVSIDDTEVPISPCPTSGTICFEMPPGVHTVKLRLGMTTTRRIAALISFVSILLLVAILIALAVMRRIDEQ
jgi:uncharacterized membrane protein